MPRSHHTILSPALILACAGLTAAPHAIARQSAPPPTASSTSSPFSGRDFAGINLPAAPQPYNITLSASRASVWNERSTNRILIERDAIVTIGPYTFHASRASIWLEPVLIDDQPADQVAVYLEDVNNPANAVNRGIQSANRLLVTAVLIDPDIKLRTDLIERGRPFSDFLDRAEQRLSRYLDSLAAPTDTTRAERKIYGLPIPRGNPPLPPLIVQVPPPEDDRVAPIAPIAPDPFLVDRPRSPDDPGAIVIPPAYADNRPDLPPARYTEPIMPTGGNVAFSAGETRFLTRPDGTQAVALTGSVALQIVRDDDDPIPGADRRRSQQITAERAVVFLASDTSAGFAGYNVDSVQGVYIEGDAVLTEISREGDVYTLRASRLYYDIKTNKAMLLDAVFFTHTDEYALPLYLRADAIRQHTTNQWSASDAQLSNVAFADPHFAIGLEEVTITRVDRPTAVDGFYVDAEGVGFKVGELPVLGIPSLKGELRPGPLREVGYERLAGDNVIRTTWDLFTLLGVDAPSGNRADLILDGYFERGPAGGIDLEWQRDRLSGSLYGYMIYDNGTDNLTSGAEIKQNEEFRGVVTGENIWRLDEEWTLFLEGSYISDETFIDAFFESAAEERREFTNSAYLRRLEDNELISIEARATFNDFISNEYLLQTDGYVVQRLPEIKYARVAEQIFELFSYTAEASFSRMSLVFNEPELRDQGFNTPRRSEAGFGLLPTDSLADQLEAQGYVESAILRFDTRHEVEVPLVAGPFNIVPFVVGRFTIYDNDFEQFRGPNANDDKYRFWASGGVRASTSIVRVDDSVRSQLFDLNRMRHIIEPHATIWSSGTTLQSEDLPVYDQTVEGIDKGTVFRAGVTQTWQTKRGQGENTYSADWIILNADYVWSSNDSDIDSPYPRFLDFRPEYSFLGEFFDTDARMNLTNAFALVGEFTHDITNNRAARATGGVRIDHGYGFETFAETRYYDGLDGTIIAAGIDYELSRKYALGISAIWDIDDDDLQRLDLNVIRRFPQWTLLMQFELDEIADDVSIGVTLQPAGFSSDPRTRIFTYEEETLEPIRSPSALRRGTFSAGPLGG